MKRLIWSLALGLFLWSAACTNIYTPTPSLPTATLPPLATFTPRYTATPIPTPSPRPTFTYTPSITPIPPTLTDEPSPTPTPPTIGRVSSVRDAVNLREGPGTTYTIIQGVVNNTDVIILSQTEDQLWYNIRLEDGTEGWIAENLIFLLPTATPLPTATVPGVVLEVSGTPLATALLGGQPITATPSFTPTRNQGTTVSLAPTLLTPGTVTATATGTATLEPGANIPTVTPGLPATATLTPSRTPTTVSGTAQPARVGYDVLAYCEQFNEVPTPLAAGTTIDVFWGWIATTEAYLQQHIDNVIYEVRFDGRLLNNWRLYADQVRRLADGRYSIYWYVPIEEPLTPGTYTISYRVTWRNPIFDGVEQFGPGTAKEFETGSCTFEVR